MQRTAKTAVLFTQKTFFDKYLTQKGNYGTINLTKNLSKYVATSFFEGFAHTIKVYYA